MVPTPGSRPKFAHLAIRRRCLRRRPRYGRKHRVAEVLPVAGDDAKKNWGASWGDCNSRTTLLALKGSEDFQSNFEDSGDVIYLLVKEGA